MTGWGVPFLKRHASVTDNAATCLWEAKKKEQPHTAEEDGEELEGRALAKILVSTLPMMGPRAGPRATPIEAKQTFDELTVSIT